MLKNGLMLISFAWAMEIVGVTGGVINSVYTTFGDELPGTLAGYIPALPMVALAAAELGRVPLASAIFHKHWLMMMVALVGIISLGYIAVENWTFGFERVVDLRLKPVKTAIREVQRAEAELSRLREQGERLVADAGRKREEMRAGAAQHDGGISDLTAQLAKEAETHQKNLEGIREACRIIRDACMVPRSQAEDARYVAVVNRLGTDLEHQREERKALQKQIDGWVAADAADTADIDRKNAIAAYAATEARKAFRVAADGNQIFRLAANWYGVATADVTPEQFATVRWVFSTFSAVAIAFVGSVAALVHYSNNRVPGSSLVARLAVSCACPPCVLRAAAQAASCRGAGTRARGLSRRQGANRCRKGDRAIYRQDCSDPAVGNLDAIPRQLAVEKRRSRQSRTQCEGRAGSCERQSFQEGALKWNSVSMPPI
jgi:hypothetical protein